jgi:hypothetical protein
MDGSVDELGRRPPAVRTRPGVALGDDFDPPDFISPTPLIIDQDEDIAEFDYDVLTAGPGDEDDED